MREAARDVNKRQANKYERQLKVDRQRQAGDS
jgi:hypothetical protein